MKSFDFIVLALFFISMNLLMATSQEPVDELCDIPPFPPTCEGGVSLRENSTDTKPSPNTSNSHELATFLTKYPFETSLFKLAFSLNERNDTSSQRNDCDPNGQFVMRMGNQPLLHLKWLPSFGLAVVCALTDSATGMNWEWYCALNQPPWDYKGNYPTHFFFLIGLGLNIGIGISSFAVWQEGGGLEGARVPLALYGAQLVLQWTYLPLLMGCKSVGWALVDLSLATGLAGATTILFRKIHERTLALMIPYMVFLSIANFHTLALYAFNRGDKSIQSRTPQEEQAITP